MPFVFSGRKEARSGALGEHGAFVFSCFTGLFFWACFFFLKEGSTISWAEPGWEAGQGRKRLPPGPVESDDKGDSPFVVSFSLLGAFVFFLAGGRDAPWRGGICFFFPPRFVFPGLFFSGGREGRFPGWGPDGKLTIKFTCPKGLKPKAKPTPSGLKASKALRL